MQTGKLTGGKTMKRKSVSFLAVSLAAVMSLSDAVVVAAAPAEEIPVMDEGQADDVDYDLNIDDEIISLGENSDTSSENESGTTGSENGTTGSESETGEGESGTGESGSSAGESGSSTGESGGTTGEGDTTESSVESPAEQQTVALPTVDELKNVIKANLKDNESDSEKVIAAEDIIKDYAVSGQAGEENNVIDVTVSGSELKSHKNADGLKAYWLGVGIPQPSQGVSVKYFVSTKATTETDLSKLEYEEAESSQAENGKTYDTFYFGKYAATPFYTGYVYAQYSNGTETKCVTYVVDMSGVTFDNPLPLISDINEGINVATLHDTADVSADGELVKAGTYSASAETTADGTNVIRVTAEDLVYHQAGDGAGMGYWVGVAIPVQENVVTSYKQHAVEGEIVYNSNPDNHLFNAEGRKTHDTFYFNVKNMTDGKDMLYVRYAASDAVDEKDVVEYAYEVDFTNVKMLPTADNLRASATSVTIGEVGEGQTERLPQNTVKVAVEPAGAYAKLVAESSDSGIATAEINNGVLTITGHANGEAKITVKDMVAGESKDISVTVGGKYQAVKDITLTPAKKELEVGDKIAVEYVLNPKNVTDTAFTWTSSNPEVATVDQDGNVTALAAGKTVIKLTATHIGGKEDPVSGESTIVVKPAATTLTINSGDLVLTAGNSKYGIKAESYLLSAKVYPESATATAVTWSSSKESVATVNDGLVTAKSAGEAVITATVKSGDKEITKSVNVTVTAIPDSDAASYEEGAAWIGAIDGTGLTYTGSGLKPLPNVYYDDTLLTEGVDYTVTYSNNINAYDYSGTTFDKKAPAINVKLTGNYSGSVSRNFSIAQASINDGSASDIYALVKTGKNATQYLKPEVRVGQTLLKEGKDYELSYPDKTKTDADGNEVDAEGAYARAGEYKIVITGKGNFTGSKEIKEVLIDSVSAVNLAKAEVKGLEKSYKYGDTIDLSKITVTGLKEGEFKAEYVSGFGLVGTNKVRITSAGTNCYGSKVVSFKVTKNPIDIATIKDFGVSVNGNVVKVTDDKQDGTPQIEYNASGVKPMVSIPGLASSDYSVTNKVAKDGKTGTITIKGKGNYYKGKVKVSYNIVPLDIADQMFVADAFVASNKKNAYQKNKITVIGENGKTLKANKDYTLDWSSNPEVPEAGDTVYVTVKGKGGYEDSYAIVSFDVVETKEQKIGTAKVKVSPVKYDGSAVELDESDINLTVGSGKKAVALKSTDYSIISYLNNNKVGTASVIIQGEGAYSGIRVVNFRITK